MIDSLFFLGYPKPFLNICNIYPPKVYEICKCEYYPLYSKWLLITKEEIEDEYSESKRDPGLAPDPFDYIFDLASQEDENGNRPYEDYFIKAFEFFIHEPVSFLYDLRVILIGDIAQELKNAKELSDLRFLFKGVYFDFQNELRASLGKEPVEPPDPDEDPRVKRIKAKARYRDRIKAKQGGGISLTTSLVSICCMGIGITPLNIGEISICAVEAITSVYQNKEKYDIDIKSLLAGADSKKVKPQYWIRNF